MPVQRRHFLAGLCAWPFFRVARTSDTHEAEARVFAAYVALDLAIPKGPQELFRLHALLMQRKWELWLEQERCGWEWDASRARDGVILRMASIQAKAEMDNAL